MTDITLSPDQQEAFDVLLSRLLTAGSESTLAGAAGCGKTTLTRELLRALAERGIDAVLAATTGRAALRLQEVSGYPASTIHSLLYDKPKNVNGRPVFEKAHPPCAADDVLIIDESSMMGKTFYEKLMKEVPKSARVLFVGDHEQLSPVKDEWGPNLQNASATLTKVHRQALDSNIIGYATAIRENRCAAWEVEYSRLPGGDDVRTLHGEDDAVGWYLDRREAGEDSIIITYTHKVRRDLNKRIRAHFGRHDPFTLETGDRMVIKTNNKNTGLRNGEVVDITHIFGDEYDERAKMWVYDVGLDNGHRIEIPVPFIGADGDAWWGWRSETPKKLFENFHHVQHGHCLTVHSCQGSQFDNVVFIEDGAFEWLRDKDPEEAKRLQYTAVTRAVKKLRVAFL